MTRLSWLSLLQLSSLFSTAYSQSTTSASITTSTTSTTTAIPSALPPWSFSTFDYGWDPINDTLTQCGHITVTWQNSRDAHYLKPVPPFTMEWWRQDHAPYRLPVPFDQKTHEYNWQVDLPVGGPYLVSMHDGNGATGGTGAYLFTVLPPESSNTCTQANLPSNALDLILPDSSSFVQCATLPISVRGGRPPYKLTVLPKSNPPKSVSFSTGDFEYTLDVEAGTDVLLSVEDSTGLGAIARMFVVGKGTKVDASCLDKAETLAPNDLQLVSVYNGKTVTMSSSTVIASIAARTPTATSPPQTSSQWWTGHLWIIAVAIVGGALLFVFIYMAVRLYLFSRARKQAGKAKSQASQDDSPSLLGDSSISLTTAGPNGKAMTGAWIGTPRSQRLPPPGGFTPSPGGGFGQSPRRRNNASSPAGTPLTDTPVRRASRAGQKGKYSIITSLDDEEDEPRPAVGRTNSLYSSEYMQELRKNAGPVPTSYNVVPNPDTEKLPSTYFAVAPGPAGSRTPTRVSANANADADAGQRAAVPGTREFNRAYAEAKFPKRPTGFPASTSTLALVGEEEPLPLQGTSASASTATLVATQETGNGGEPQARAQSWFTFRVPDTERSRSSSPRYPPGLEPQTEEEEMEEVEADIAYEGMSLEDEDDERGLLDSLKEVEDAEDSSLPYRSSKARNRSGDAWQEHAGGSSREEETTPRRYSPQQQQTTPARRPLPPTPTQALVSTAPWTAWPHPPKKEHEEDDDEVQWGTTIRLLNSQGSLRSATTADSDEQYVTGRAI